MDQIKIDQQDDLEEVKEGEVIHDVVLHEGQHDDVPINHGVVSLSLDVRMRS